MAIQMNAEFHRGGMLLFLLLACGAYGLDRERTIGEFFHTSWTVSEGGPAGLTQMAQTSDGYLWLGTQTGLIRFDGVRFERYEPVNCTFPANTISALMAVPDGGLWIGFVPHGAAFLKGGKAVLYGEGEGLPTAPVYAFGRDAEGAIWIGTSRGLSRFIGSAWKRIGADWGFPEVSIESFFLDREGRFWVSTADGLFCLLPHARLFQRRSGGSMRLGQSEDGAIWSVGSDNILRPLSSLNTRQPTKSKTVIGQEADQLLVDRDGGMWILTEADGIARIAKPEKLGGASVAADSDAFEHFTRRDGLSDNRVTSALEDREGNIWIATRGGLDRLRRRNVVPGLFPYGIGGRDLALVAGVDGAVWAGNMDQPLMRVRNHALSFVGGPRSISCAYRDPDGILWFGGVGTLTRFSGNRLENLEMPREIRPDRYWPVQAITRDALGGLWVSVTQNGVFRLNYGVWTHWGSLSALPRRTAVTAWTDPAGRVWFGYTVDMVAVVDGNQVQTFSSAEGLRVGAVTAIASDFGHIWVGGEFGVAMLYGKQFRMMTGVGAGFRGVSGIVATANGDLWLNQASGLVHIARPEIEAALKDFRHELRYELFDFHDGVLGTASPVSPLPSAIMATDGRIWLSGTSGASWIDPARIYRNELPPPVAIGSIYVNGELYTAASTLPVLPSNVQIEYTALSLSIPERVRFRYRLEGFEKEWQDAGTRRDAFYTRLGPGRYRFHVLACNNDGVWNGAGAALDLVVPPAFYQTSWFIALEALAGGSLLYGFYLLRLRQMAWQMQGRMEERLAERERIARELHDTLLQGIQGLILRFQAAAKQVSPGEPARLSMEEALDRADEVMLEGRDRVRNLRAPTETGNALSQAFTLVGEELLPNCPATAFRVVTEGGPEELHALVQDDVYRIGREALVNAFSHAQAQEIELELAYKRSELQLRVRDDGRGIDPDVLDTGSRPGHWGLTGMRERARKMKAHLDIRSRHGAGTEIELRVPATVAYRARVSGSLFRWPRRARYAGRRKEASR